jgi:pantoate--beta-alanine ligase
MQTLDTVSAMQSLTRDLRASGRTVALVPTMGALHQGHIDLIRLAVTRADVVVVSIFINPAQFGANEDSTQYPRDPEGDAAKATEAGAHYIFQPNQSELYPNGYSTFVDEESVAKPLEGISRPTHFRGVTTIITKLFNIVQPHIAVFGQKDAQQVSVIRKLVADLHLTIEIVTAPTTRDPDGVALSSRNRYLSTGQRTAARAIPDTLQFVKGMVDRGERRAERLVAETTHLLGEHRQLRVIYAAVVDRDTMQSQREVIPGQSLLAIAAWADQTRLIDNIIL